MLYKEAFCNCCILCWRQLASILNGLVPLAGDFWRVAVGKITFAKLGDLGTVTH